MENDNVRMWRYWAYGEVAEAGQAAGIFMIWTLLEGLEPPLSVPLAHTERPINWSGSSAHSFTNVQKRCFKNFHFGIQFFGWLV